MQNESPNDSVFKPWSHDVHISVSGLRFSLLSWVFSTLPYWPFICLIFWLQETVSFLHAYARNSICIRHQSDHIIFSCSSPTDWEKGQGDLKGKNRKQGKYKRKGQNPLRNSWCQSKQQRCWHNWHVADNKTPEAVRSSAASTRLRASRQQAPWLQRGSWVLLHSCCWSKMDGLHPH